jgi:hypothetical protein
MRIGSSSFVATMGGGACGPAMTDRDPAMDRRIPAAGGTDAPERRQEPTNSAARAKD